MRLAPTRDRIGSLLQSAVEEVLRRDGHIGRPTLAHPLVHAATVAAGHLEQSGAIPADPPSHLAAEGRQVWKCIRLAGETLAAHARGDHTAYERAKADGKFSDCDLRWGEVLLDYLALAGPTAEIPYVRHASLDDFVLPILPPNARVALLGDWGTGTPEAKALLADVARRDPQAIVHLGDVYYAATPHEMQEHFLALIDEVFPRKDGRVPVFTLCGNHDLYSGGSAYYASLSQLNPAPAFAKGTAQSASYFSLRTTDGAWQLLAMDTGLHDRDPTHMGEAVTHLEESEEAWHADKVARFPGRTILLSHHQAFSAFAPIGEYTKRAEGDRAVNPNLMASHRQIAAGGDVAAWFWGHEHNLCVYEPFAGIARGRCIGHAGVPALLLETPYDVLEDLTAPPRLVKNTAGSPLELGNDGVAYHHGYAMLEFNDAARTATVRYYEVGREAPIYEETF